MNTRQRVSNLKDIGQQINEVDRKIVALLSNRAALCRKIFEEKNKLRLAFCRPEVEKERADEWRKFATIFKHPDPESVFILAHIVFALSKSDQLSLVDRKNKKKSKKISIPR